MAGRTPSQAALDAAEAARKRKQVASGKTKLNLALLNLDEAIVALSEGGYHELSRKLVGMRGTGETVLRQIIDKMANDLNKGT